MFSRFSISISMIAAYSLFALFCPLLSAQAPSCMPKEWLSVMKSGITVDLRNPVFSENTLATDEGGIVEATGFRVQARHILLTRLERDGEFFYRIDASGDLQLEYRNALFTAASLTYDFSTRTGVLSEARSAMLPWFFHAESILLLETGDYKLQKVHFTTSPTLIPDWHIEAKDVHITPEHILYGKNITLRLGVLPVFWLPCWRTDLTLLGDSPIRYYYRFGGFQGPKLGITYRWWKSEFFTSSIRLDYRFSRGPGATLETAYQNPSSDLFFATRTLAARDSSLNDPRERFRYRLQGVYKRPLLSNTVTLCASYDKMSDEDVPTDYADRDWEIQTAGLTQCALRAQLNACILNLITRIRANPFETVKEELPTYNIHFKPFVLGSSGIISQNEIEVGYFQFRYSNEQPHLKDYASTRVELRHLFYRPIEIGMWQWTPSAGLVAIYYGKDREPKHTPACMVLGTFGMECTTSFYRTFGNYKHVLLPYARYSYYTYPTMNPNKIYQFDISDGWYTINSAKIGLRSLVYERPPQELLPWLRLSGDLYTYAFIDSHTVKSIIPRVYGDLQWDISPVLRWTIQSAWDFQHGRVDHYNHRLGWTVSDALALSFEYRHRSSYCWRKVEPDNLILDFFRTEERLRHSLVSDRRDTVLLHAYYQIRHNMTLEGWMHTGWNRIKEPNYIEYQVDLTQVVRSSWSMRLSYQHKQDDHRIAFYFNLGVRALGTCDPFPHCRSRL